MSEHHQEEIGPYRQNLALKQAFVNLGLDLSAVFEALPPQSTDRENDGMERLLNFIEMYERHGSRQIMEMTVDNDEDGEELSPPLSPMYGPEGDWHRFERWMRGEPTRLTVAEQLPPGFIIKKPEEIPADEMEAELEAFIDAIRTTGFEIELKKDIPAVLSYIALLNFSMEVLDVCGPKGGLTEDFCTGDCVRCFQRPWCESGTSSCSTEDIAAGKIHFCEELAPFVSASPQSLGIITKLKAKEDAWFAKMKWANYPHKNGPFLAHYGLLTPKEWDDLPF